MAIGFAKFGEKQPDQAFLADVVKSVHARLREDYKKGLKPEDVLWQEHLLKEDELQKYAESMYSLATDLWMPRNVSDTSGTRDRIEWCVSTCVEYFQSGLLVKLVTKDLKRMDHGAETLLDASVLSKLKNSDIEEFVLTCFPKPWSLLDVGSCYNPFVMHVDLFTVTAIDIAPACESVLKCDFLNVNIVPKTEPRESEHCVFSRESFDVVVFSLLLSYFPSSRQRLKCCLNAFQLLKLHGLLLIITPDSSHLNKNMAMVKSWQWALHQLGFTRWKYTKQRHLHCMAFRKCHEQDLSPSISTDELAEAMYIPQDQVVEGRYAVGGSVEDKPHSDPVHAETRDPEQTTWEFGELPNDF